MERINEKTTYFITVTFRDEDGTLVVPTAAYYSLYCETTKTEILAESAFPGLASSVEITVTSTQNAIIRDLDLSEIKLMTVRFTYNAGADQGTDEYRWEILNLKRLT